MPDPINRFARFAHIVCSARSAESAALAAVMRLRSLGGTEKIRSANERASGQNPGPGPIRSERQRRML